MLGICYGMQLMAQELGGRVERTGASEFGKTADPRRRRPRRGHAGRADGVDEPPRLRDRAARGRGGHRRVALDADRRVRGAGARPVRRPVPPRGRAHAARPGGAEELPLRRRRRPADLDAGGGDRGAGRADPRPGRPRARAVRALGRRRLGGRRAARAQGGRRPTHVRLRRPRPAAQGRGGAGGRDVRGPLPRPARPRRRRPTRFLARLEGVTEPEEKRRIIGEEFIRVFEEEADRLGEHAASSSRGRSTRT